MEIGQGPPGFRLVHLVREPFDEHPTGGLLLKRRENPPRIQRILENTSAESAGLRVGDTIVEVGGNPCDDILVPELEGVIEDFLNSPGDNGVWLLVASSTGYMDRQSLQDDDYLQEKRLTDLPGRKKRKGRPFRSRGNMFPSEHPDRHQQKASSIGEHAAITTPRRRTALRKVNLDAHARFNRVSHLPIHCGSDTLRDAATNTEYQASYFMKAGDFRATLKTRKDYDHREPGNFAKIVEVYESMRRNKRNKDSCWGKSLRTKLTSFKRLFQSREGGGIISSSSGFKKGSILK